MKIFAERLKELRIEKGLSQKKLADITNISQSAIAKWEINQAEPTAIAIVTIAMYFSVTSDFLLGLENEYGNKTNISNSFNNSFNNNINIK